MRFGTPAATSRGFNNEDFTNVGNMIADALDSLSAAKPQPGGSEGMDEDGPIGEEAAKEAAQEAAHDPAK